MATTDYDIIKDIPGYKVILKAVLKSQIQQLVEQLAASTDEESVILTASVADGTLSHLGSKSGKGFLEDHEDIKSQFLGFCLKSHHKKKQEEEQERIAAELLQQSANASPGRYQGPTNPYTARSQRFSSSGQGSVHPVSLTRASPGAHIRSAGVRHEPYQVKHPHRKTVGSFETSCNPSTGPQGSPEMVVKVEPIVDSGISNQSERDALKEDNTDIQGQFTSPYQNTLMNVLSDSGDKNDSANESYSEGLGEDSGGGSYMPSDNMRKQGGEGREVDTDVCVKVETSNESEMDLEITGVEPAKHIVSQDNWDPNTSGGASYDLAGAVGNQSDIATQGTNTHNIFLEVFPSSTGTGDGPMNLDPSVPSSSRLESREALEKYSEFFSIIETFNTLAYMCTSNGCEKVFKTPRDMLRHIRTHTKEKPFRCRICGINIARKDRWKAHENKHKFEFL